MTINPSDALFLAYVLFAGLVAVTDRSIGIVYAIGIFTVMPSQDIGTGAFLLSLALALFSRSANTRKLDL